MVYTIGLESSYKKGYLEHGSLIKIGRCKLNPEDKEEYPGGIVFKSRSSANKYLEMENITTYIVLRVNANWDKDTYDHPKGTRNLKRDAIIQVPTGWVAERHANAHC